MTFNVDAAENVDVTEIPVTEPRIVPAPYLPFRQSAHLSQEEANALMHRMLSGGMEIEEIVAVLKYLRRKGETLAELVGFAMAIRQSEQALTFDAADGPVMDTCGTGGDGTNTFNVSTATAFVVAAAGVRVAKHGNRKISSQCGSADVLEQLGVSIKLTAEQVRNCIQTVGLGFLFAPAIHPAMRHVAAARQSLGGRTVFNLLGPLTNPVQARVQLIGAYSVRAAELLAQAAARLGVQRAFVVHGADGLDEITTTSHTTVFRVNEGTVQKERWFPRDFHVPEASPPDLTGGDPETNAGIIRSVLAGTPGAQRDIVIVNAAACLLLAGKVSDLESGAAAAIEVIESGSAERKLQDLISFTQEHHESV